MEEPCFHIVGVSSSKQCRIKVNANARFTHIIFFFFFSLPQTTFCLSPYFYVCILYSPLTSISAAIAQQMVLPSSEEALWALHWWRPKSHLVEDTHLVPGVAPQISICLLSFLLLQSLISVPPFATGKTGAIQGAVAFAALYSVYTQCLQGSWGRNPVESTW